MNQQKPAKQAQINEINENLSSGHKPYLHGLTSKITPIGQQFHQAEIPQLQETAQPIPRHKDYLRTLTPQFQPQSCFLQSRAKQQDLEQYLCFCENYFEDKMPDYFSQGLASRQSMRARSLDFLHQMDYNYTKAKFYIFFPYYLTYNRSRSHMPLNFPNQEMEKKIKDHIEGMKNTKEKDLLKWIGTVENSIDNRVSLARLNTLIQVAKQNKFQIPETIKDQIQRAVKTGKELKKFIQGSRIPIEKLVQRRQQLNQNKIVTSDMIQFQETVNRSEQWMKKQLQFEQKYYTFTKTDPSATQEVPIPVLKSTDEKVEFKLIQTLTNEYNNLPLLYENFSNTTKVLYNNTINILDRLPPFTKMTKTRTSNPTKYSYQAIRELLDEIKIHPVNHQDFTTFQMIVSESMELIEKVTMFIEDDRTEKNVKIMNHYLKLITELPIHNRIQQKLESTLEYYELMEKIRKDIMNPQKFDQIKDYIKRLRERGFQTIQHASYESKLRTYIGWIESAQILNQNRYAPTYYDLIKYERQIKQNMVNADLFEGQLNSAQKQLNIGQQAYAQFSKKLQNVALKKDKIKEIILENSPNIHEMIEQLFECIKCGLWFPQFNLLYHRVITYLVIIAKIHYILDIHNTSMLQDFEAPFLTKKQAQDILVLIKSSKQQLKEMKSRQGATQILQEIQKSNFPKKLLEWRNFQNFMENDNQSRNKVLSLIREFQSEDNIVNSRDIIEESKKCLYSKTLDDEVTKIESIIKWRQKITKKISEPKDDMFDTSEKQFIEKFKRDILEFESIKGDEATRNLALGYFQKHSKQIKKILQSIHDYNIQSTYKLSELNKFCKEIDREVEKFQLNDKKITELRQKLQKSIEESEQWKEKYLSIKRFQSKKIRQTNDNKSTDNKNNEDNLKEITVRFDFSNGDLDENHNDNQEDKNNIQDDKNNMEEDISNKAHSNKQNQIANGQLYWYFKLLLMIIEFYNGYNLQFALDQLTKLKALLGDIYKFIVHYEVVFAKDEPNDSDLQNLQIQGNRIVIFFREIWVLRKKIQYINSWKTLANDILESVPIINMELRARKPEELLTLIESQKKLLESEEAGKVEEKKPQENRNRRKPKPNQYYVNQDMTIITEQTFGNKNKKRRKNNNNNVDSQYKNTTVKSMVKQQSKKKQIDIERTEALLKGDRAGQFFYQDTSQYCICRFGQLNQNTVMVQCEGKCEEWFHIQCVGLKKSQTKGETNLYICIGCRNLYNIESNEHVGNFFWDNHYKITEFAFQTIMEEGSQLNVATTEMKKLDVINEKMLKWKQKSYLTIQKVLKDEGQEHINENDQQLYELYLNSFWLPTVHPQSQIIKRLLLANRGEL